MPILLGLTGPKESGKDTAFASIKSWGEGRGLSVVRRGFADKLKYSALRALGFDVSLEDAIVLADQLKEMGEINSLIPGQSLSHTITGRQFLQNYGTEAHREIFGSDFWVDALLPFGSSYSHIHHRDEPIWVRSFTDLASPLPDICVVTDVRFDNEAQRILDLRGTNFKIDPGERLQQEDGHASEAGVSPHLIHVMIDNSKDLDWLDFQIQSEMTIEFGEGHVAA